MQVGGYKKLEVYRKAHALAVRTHAMTLQLPKFEMYEEGSQIRRSSKRVSASIVEGYGVRRYKALYLSYLYRALGSADETQEHLELLHETGSLSDAVVFRELQGASRGVSQMLARFIDGVERQHTRPHGPEDLDPEVPTPDDPDAEAAVELRRLNRKSGIGNRESNRKEPRNGN